MARERGWLPGRCGLLPLSLLHAGRAAGHRSGCGDVIARSRIGKRLWQMRRSFGSVDGPKRSLRRVRGDEAKAGIHGRCGARVAGPRAAFYFRLPFALLRVEPWSCVSWAPAIFRGNEGDLRHFGEPSRIDNMVPMDPSVLHKRLYWIAGGYAAVIAVSAALIVVRYLQYVMHPQDAAAYGGMWAGGDLMLELFICLMLLGMTFILVLAIFRSESAYTTYSKVLLGLSLTAPLSVALLLIPAVNQGANILGYAGMFRLFASPVMVVAIGMSLLWARFPRAKKLILYALLTEIVTLVLLVGSLGGVFGHLLQE